jgi:hypothetical protein
VSRIHDALTLLAACLCTEATDNGEGPDLCFCGILPGDAVVHDYGFGDECDGTDGMAWVRLMMSYPSSAVGSADTTPNNCIKPTGIDVEVGILRGYPIEEQVTAATAAAAVEGQFADHDRIMRAVLCCEAFSRKDIVLGQYTPVGPMGGVFGGVLVFSSVV